MSWVSAPCARDGDHRKKVASVKRALLLAAFLILLAPSPALIAQSSGYIGAASCADPAGVLSDFYDANDAGRFDASVRLLTDDAVLATWATGVNGHKMVLRNLEGRAQIRQFLPQGRGFAWRLPGAGPDGPVYRRTKLAVAGNVVRFVLEPDRRRPTGGLYNYFSVEAVLAGCRIASLTVIEQITWL